MLRQQRPNCTILEATVDSDAREVQFWHGGGATGGIMGTDTDLSAETAAARGYSLTPTRTQSLLSLLVSAGEIRSGIISIRV